MELRSLKYLEAVARHGSFTKAARELGIAQPALSIAIAKLEDELGVTLFSREARQVVALPEAKLLIRRAVRVFEELRLARQELQAAAELRIGEVKIGIPPMFGQVYISKVIADFHRAHPDIMITAMEGSAYEVKTMLDSGAIDLGILENRRVPAGWQSIEVGVDETVLCVNHQHPLAGRSAIKARELNEMPMAVFERSFLQRWILDELCNDADVSYRIVIQSNFVHLIHEAVASGLGAATLLKSIAIRDKRLCFVPFDPICIFRFSLCWRPDHVLSRPNQAFVEMAKHYAHLTLATS